jgi:hypothetical protein
MTESLYSRLKGLAEAKKVGFLGNYLTFLCYAYSCMSHGQKTPELVASELQKKEMFVEIALYGSEIAEDAAGLNRNFTLGFGEVGGYRTCKQAGPVIHSPYHFHWNGSWEGLDQEIRNDIKTLKKLGYRFLYEGYNKEKDCFVKWQDVLPKETVEAIDKVVDDAVRIEAKANYAPGTL